LPPLKDPNTFNSLSKKEIREKFRMMASDHYNKGFDIPGVFDRFGAGGY
jgi:hypothetical protein